MMEAIATLLTLAILVEAVVETVKLSLEGGVKWPMVAAMLLGVGVALLSGAGILSAVGVSVPFWADAVLSGILVGRGSNFISDLFGKLNRKQA